MGFLFLWIMGCSFASLSAPASTPSSAETPVTIYNAPGKYSFTDKCYFTLDMTMESGSALNPVPEFRMAELLVCVSGVLVNEDLSMQFEIEYTLTPTEPEAGPVWRDTERDNRNVFLTDDKSGRYEFIAVGGCAAKEMRTNKESLKCKGWFLFPPAQSGATSFEFHYSTSDTMESTDDHGIPDIVLANPE